MAMGCMGMSRWDFCSCTPSEFSAVAEQWERVREEASRRSWEQARFIATACLQPYTKRALSPTDVARFPWDRGNPIKGTSSLDRMHEVEKRPSGEEK